MRGEKRRDPETGEADFYYLVHYIGWNKNFDQWFTEGEIIKVCIVLISILLCILLSCISVYLGQ